MQFVYYARSSLSFDQFLRDTEQLENLEKRLANYFKKEKKIFRFPDFFLNILIEVYVDYANKIS